MITVLDQAMHDILCTDSFTLLYRRMMMACQAEGRKKATYETTQLKTVQWRQLERARFNLRATALRCS